MIPHTLVTSCSGAWRIYSTIHENSITLASDQTFPLLELVIIWQKLHNTELRSEMLPQSLWKALIHAAALCSGNKALGSFLVLKWGDEFCSGPVGREEGGTWMKRWKGWKDTEQGIVMYCHFTDLMCSSLGSMWMWLSCHRGFVYNDDWLPISRDAVKGSLMALSTQLASMFRRTSQQKQHLAICGEKSYYYLSILIEYIIVYNCLFASVHWGMLS